MTALIFNYQEKYVRTVTDENGDVWFAGVDVCNILGYSMASNIITSRLDDDEKKLTNLRDGSGQNRRTWIVNESGLYSLILSSQKKEAKVFRRWITHEVIPSIRKTGKYEKSSLYTKKLEQFALQIEELKAQRDFHLQKSNECRKKIEATTNRMLTIIKSDPYQLNLYESSTEPNQ